MSFRATEPQHFYLFIYLLLPNRNQADSAVLAREVLEEDVSVNLRSTAQGCKPHVLIPRPVGGRGGCGPKAPALFVWTPQRLHREQMWEGRRLGSQPEQLGEIKNNSIPGDWANYSGKGGRGGGSAKRQTEREF